MLAVQRRLTCALMFSFSFFDFIFEFVRTSDPRRLIWVEVFFGFNF